MIEIANSKYDEARKAGEFENQIVVRFVNLSKFLIGKYTRSFCILLTSFSEDCLRQNFIDKWNINNKSKIDAYFGGNGPLSTFAQRTLVATGLGWITADGFQEINALRKIRNELSHSYKIHSLKQEPLYSLCQKLTKREETWLAGKFYKAAFEKSDLEEKLKLRIFCATISLISNALARANLIKNNLHPDFRAEGGWHGMTDIEQKMLDTMIDFCFTSLNIEHSGL